MNFIGAVFVWCSLPAAKQVFYDSANSLNLPGAALLNNNTALMTKNNAGTSFSSLRMDAGNVLNIDAGANGLNINNQNESAQFLSIGSTGLISQAGVEWTATIRTDGSTGGCLGLKQSAVPPAHSAGLNVNLQETASLFAFFSFGALSTNTGSIATNGTTTTYNTTSDQTLKINDGEIPAEDSGSLIDKLIPRWFRWKSEPDGHSEPGFFAQEVSRVFSWAVTKGRGRKGSENWMPWQMDNSKLMPIVVAELKALRKRVADLEALHGEI